MTAKTLRKIAAGLMLLSIAAYMVVAVVGVLTAKSYDVAEEVVGILTFCVLMFFVALALFGIAWFVDWCWPTIERQVPPLTEAWRKGRWQKPPGWNEAVLGWFFAGPERRPPRAGDFSDAFHARLAEKEEDQQVRDYEALHSDGDVP